MSGGSWGTWAAPDRYGRWAQAAQAGALVVAVVRCVAGNSAGYERGFAPPWVAVAGTVLALLALRSGLGRRGRLIGGVGAALLVWSAGGVLFDLLRVVALAGVPGLPPQVDWPGFVSRAFALTAAATLTAVLVARERRSRSGSAEYGPAEYGGHPHGRSSQSPRRRAGLLAAVLVLPYPAIKVYWWAGGSLARAAMGPQSSEGFPYGEVTVFAAAGLAALALAYGWPLPRRLLLVSGWTATGILVTMGSLAGFGMLAQAMGLIDGPVGFTDGRWIVSVVYGSWLALGLAMGVATTEYARYHPHPRSAPDLGPAAVTDEPR